jgi:hypothetical protein
MRSPGVLLLCFLLASCAAPLATRPGTEPASLALTHVSVIPMHGGTPLRDQTVLIHGARITRIGPAEDVRLPSGARVVDARGKFLIPGLWDMHVHLRGRSSPAEIDLPLYVANGVTGVREMSSDCYGQVDAEAGCIEDLRRWQRQLESGELLGPRLLALGSWGVNGPSLPDSLPPFFAARTEAEGRELARYFVGRKVDFIKVLSRIPREGYFGLMDEARRHGLPVTGHEPLTVSAAEVSMAGQRTVEHARVFLTNCFPGAEEFRRVSKSPSPSTRWSRRMVDEHEPARCEELFRLFARNGTRYVPTHVTRRMDAFAHDPVFRSDPRSKYVPEPWWEEWNRDADQTVAADPSPEGLRARMDFYLEGLALTGAAHRAGVELLLGTDAGDSFVFPGFSVHDELEELVKAGLTPAEALDAATWSSAKFLGRESESGTVEQGKLADLVLLEANPLDDVRNTRRIHAVVLGGRLLERAELDRLLARAARAARPSPSASEPRQPASTR